MAESREFTAGPGPDDLVAVVEVCASTLEPLTGSDWTVPAGGLDWSCRQTLEHVCSLGYGPQLASRAGSFRPLALMVTPDASLDDLLWTMRVMARVLADIARYAPPEARAFHPAGMADATGFIAMGMDELLVHTHDIAEGLDAEFEPDDRLARKVLDRLFPWRPPQANPWPSLLWANGRLSLPDLPAVGAEWLWHCAPLAEWNGTVPRWDPAAFRVAALFDCRIEDIFQPDGSK